MKARGYSVCTPGFIVSALKFCENISQGVGGGRGERPGCQIRYTDSGDTRPGALWETTSLSAPCERKEPETSRTQRYNLGRTVRLGIRLLPR